MAGHRWHRWQWALRAYAGLVAFVLAGTVAVAAVALASHAVRMSPTGSFASSSHVAQWLADPPAWLSDPLIGAIAILGLSFVGHQVLSWRRAGGDRRQQLKWLACGGAVAAVSLILAVSHGVWFLAGVAALPVGIGVGILRGWRTYARSGGGDRCLVWHRRSVRRAAGS